MPDKNRQRLNTDFPAPERVIDFQVDTLTATTWAAAYFSPSVRTVTVNYVEGEDNSFNESKVTKAHEQKHRDNYDAGMKNMPMSLEQYYKVCCHDEISATMVELLQLREEYKNAKTEKERADIINSADGQRHRAYFDAVKEGKINPFANNSADFEKEMKFIATETQKMWMNNHSQWYDAAHTAMALYYFNSHDYKDIKDNPENYEKARKIAYTIGGVDFTQYMSDIPCVNENIKTADEMIMADKPRDDVDKMIKTMNFGHASAVTSLEQHTALSVLEGFSNKFKTMMKVRRQWMACKTDAERQNLEKQVNESGESFIATRWLYAANHGQIKPMLPVMSKDEQEFIGNELFSLTNAICYSDINFLKTYIDDKGMETIQKAVRSGEADKNYKKELHRLFSVEGIDFSNYVQNPALSNPYIRMADDKLKKGKKLDVAKDLRDFDASKDLIIPEIEPIAGMSMEQQLKIAQQRMFMENVKARNPFMEKQIVKKDKKQLDFSEPIFEQLGYLTPTKAQMEALQSAQIQPVDEYGNPMGEVSSQQNDFSYFPHEISFNGTFAQIYFSSFQKDLNEYPELKAKWDKAVAQMEKQIVNANRGNVFLPSANDKAYQKELNNIYTVNGVDLRASYRVDCRASEVNGLETFVPEIKNTKEIEKLEDSSWVSRTKHKMTMMFSKMGRRTEQTSEGTGSLVRDFENLMTNWLSSHSQNGTQTGSQIAPEVYRQKRWEDEHYTGEPQYRMWTPENRVSPILTAEIYDFTKPFLLQQQEALAKKEADEKATLYVLDRQRQRNTSRFDRRVDDAQQQNQLSGQQQRTTTTSSHRSQQTR